MHIQESMSKTQVFRTVSTSPERGKAQSFTGKQEMRAAAVSLALEV